MNHPKEPEAIGEVVDEKYNFVRFYRQTGDTSKPYHLPKEKLYDQACVDALIAQRDAALEQVARLKQQRNRAAQIAIGKSQLAKALNGKVETMRRYNNEANAQNDQLREQVAKLRHVGLELSGTMQEYRLMPCQSLADRMFATYDRYVGRLAPAAVDGSPEQNVCPQPQAHPARCGCEQLNRGAQ